jgi:hypothetical protein
MLGDGKDFPWPGLAATPLKRHSRAKSKQSKSTTTSGVKKKKKKEKVRAVLPAKLSD